MVVVTLFEIFFRSTIVIGLYLTYRPAHDITNILISIFQLAGFIKRILKDSIKNFIKRIRWKAFFFENESTNQMTNFGFKSVKTPPNNDQLN